MKWTIRGHPYTTEPIICEDFFHILYLKSMACHICYAEKEVMNFPKMSSGSWRPDTNQYASLSHFVPTALLRLTFHSLSSPAGSCFLSIRLIGGMRYIVCHYIEAQWMLIDHRNWKSGDGPFTSDNGCSLRWGVSQCGFHGRKANLCSLFISRSLYLIPHDPGV